MAPSFFGRCCLLGLVLISAAGLDLAAGNLGNETLEARLERFYKKILQLTEKVNKNEESIKGMEKQLDRKLTRLAEENRKLIKDSTSEILSHAPLCQVQVGNLICKTNSSGAGWIVIQQRFDGSVTFKRSWASYKYGFGEIGPNSEFWWGLERLHRHTKRGQYELLMEFKDDAGEYRFARYSELLVEGESEKYRLAKLGGYSGTAGDINAYGKKFDIPTGHMFSTYDSDNDGFGVDCASEYGGGWWYNGCGRGPNSNWNNKIKWLPWKNEALHYTRMLIRTKA